MDYKDMSEEDIDIEGFNEDTEDDLMKNLKLDFNENNSNKNNNKSNEEPNSNEENNDMKSIEIIDLSYDSRSEHSSDLNDNRRKFKPRKSNLNYAEPPIKIKWTDEENNALLLGIEKFGYGHWKEINKFIKTKTIKQIRTKVVYLKKKGIINQETMNKRTKIKKNDDIVKKTTKIKNKNNVKKLGKIKDDNIVRKKDEDNVKKKSIMKEKDAGSRTNLPRNTKIKKKYLNVKDEQENNELDSSDMLSKSTEETTEIIRITDDEDDDFYAYNEKELTPEIIHKDKKDLNYNNKDNDFDKIDRELDQMVEDKEESSIKRELDQMVEDKEESSIKSDSSDSRNNKDNSDNNDSVFCSDIIINRIIDDLTKEEDFAKIPLFNNIKNIDTQEEVKEIIKEKLQEEIKKKYQDEFKKRIISRLKMKNSYPTVNDNNSDNNVNEYDSDSNLDNNVNKYDNDNTSDNNVTKDDSDKTNIYKEFENNNVNNTNHNIEIDNNEIDNNEIDNNEIDNNEIDNNDRTSPVDNGDDIDHNKEIDNNDKISPVDNGGDIDHDKEFDSNNKTSSVNNVDDIDHNKEIDNNIRTSPVDNIDDTSHNKENDSNSKISPIDDTDDIVRDKENNSNSKTSPVDDTDDIVRDKEIDGNSKTSPIDDTDDIVRDKEIDSNSKTSPIDDTDDIVRDKEIDSNSKTSPIDDADDNDNNNKNNNKTMDDVGNNNDDDNDNGNKNNDVDEINSIDNDYINNDNDNNYDDKTNQDEDKNENENQVIENDNITEEEIEIEDDDNNLIMENENHNIIISDEEIQTVSQGTLISHEYEKYFENSKKIAPNNLKINKKIIKPIEKKLFPEWFKTDRKTNDHRTPERYKEIRNCILDEWEKKKPYPISANKIRDKLKVSYRHVVRILKVLKHLNIVDHENSKKTTGNKEEKNKSLIGQEGNGKRKRKQMTYNEENQSNNNKKNAKKNKNNDTKNDDNSNDELNKTNDKDNNENVDDFDYDQFSLINLEQFDVTDNPAPFVISILSNVLLFIEIHSHLLKTEIIGLLGGIFDPISKMIYVKDVFPCKGESANYQCEMSVESEIEAREVFSKKNLDVVGWYHSHPTFRPNPSIRDIENQYQYQKLFRNDNGIEPFIGIIVTPFYNHINKSKINVFTVGKDFDTSNSYRLPYECQPLLESSSDLGPNFIQSVKNIINDYKNYKRRVNFKNRYRKGEDFSYYNKLMIAIDPYLKNIPKDESKALKDTLEKYLI